MDIYVTRSLFDTIRVIHHNLCLIFIILCGRSFNYWPQIIQDGGNIIWCLGSIHSFRKLCLFIYCGKFSMYWYLIIQPPPPTHTNEIKIPHHTFWSLCKWNGMHIGKILDEITYLVHVFMSLYQLMVKMTPWEVLKMGPL